ncbi:MAG: COG2426 family protein [Oscillospiraceae bacterium]
MLPVLELRGAIPFGISLGLSDNAAFFASLIGNMIPVIPIILLIRQIFAWLRRYPKLSATIDRLEKRAHIKGRVAMKYRMWGLFILVAIPLPGTGAWTGALIAGVLEMRLRDSLIAIFFGVLLAGVIVLLATNGIISFLEI